MNCFIIMPITTPEELLPLYNNNPNHFKNVLDYLLTPAVKEAGMEPIPPSSEASEIIHTDIISKLISAEIVLCDISTLNANVFFELGVRTSLNKPVCFIRDDRTNSIPFDTAPIHCMTYRSGLTIMDHAEDKKMITEHLKVTYKKSSGNNAMWKAFGISQVAASPEPSSMEDKLDYLIQQFDFLRDTPWNFLNEFSPRVRNVIRNASISTIGEMTLFPEPMWLQLKGVKQSDVDEIKSVLARHGLSLGMKHKED